MLCEGHMTVSQAGLRVTQREGTGGRRDQAEERGGEVRMQGEVIRHDQAGGVEAGMSPG